MFQSEKAKKQIISRMCNYSFKLTAALIIWEPPGAKLIAAVDLLLAVSL